MTYRMRTAGLSALLLAALAVSGCDTLTAQTKPPTPPVGQQKPDDKPTETPVPTDPAEHQSQEESPAKEDPSKRPTEPTGSQKPPEQPSKPVAGAPNSLTVLVNKQVGLPDDFQPSNLIDDPNLHFLAGGGGEKRLMRAEVAAALKQLFAAAEQDGQYLSVASAYRSHATQTSLFNYYVQTQGEAEARRYSAVPGHSEHETGLAVDVSGRDGKCAVEDCFADTPEAKWLAKNSHKFGFIIRYPKGKEAVTGYAYEPWHLRYLGVDAATAIYSQNTTMEEYYKVK
ncbi:D-alanyl-D-alanine carboxypeptidase [Tumebacillus sp. BK434]|uniref:M15 family metallopeptidase n=1 Tax=Tumebacillus sp. BK434 TaxID=2512169 RepID=UPI0010E33A02|nr:D-alanyl-D-alanine carboxypeptidase family protein [Tumebacillus sp. BK434]TCP57964.1 D-alanyl-D-alanine carboxypeptidase [Tumebacillus sp. BK434]